MTHRPLPRASLRTPYPLALALVLALPTLGCGDHQHPTDGGSSTCTADPRAMAYSANLTLTGKAGALKTVLASSEPSPPYKGDNTWMVKLQDAVTNAALDGATINAVPYMPDHNHFSPYKVVVTPMGGGSGLYQLKPVNLFMAGIWEVTLSVTTAEGKADQTMFSICIEG